MVYRGKPSPACGECRKRRSRCDQKVPACGQCVKAGRMCPGYRKAIDLLFHDESRQVVSKNRDRTVEGQSLPDDANLVRAIAARPVKLTDFVMYQPLEELGVNFFMSTYVSDDPKVSQLYYLPGFYSKKGYSSAGLHQGLTAAGLAGYARVTRRRDVSDAATKHYAASIRAINVAVTDPTTALLDSTLISVVMAAISEILIDPRQPGLQNCARHIEGAVTIALLKLKQQRLSDTTYKLLMTLAQSTIINCWITQIALPRDFAELMNHLSAQSGVVDDSNMKFLNITLDMIVFREALNSGVYVHPLAIVQRAQAIDDSIAQFAESLPPKARFQSFRAPLASFNHLAHEGYYHVYSQRFAAHLWNNLRACRLRMHQVILRQCCLSLTSDLHRDEPFWIGLKTETEAGILHLASEVAAAVPQLAGYLEEVIDKGRPEKLPRLTGLPLASFVSPGFVAESQRSRSDVTLDEDFLESQNPRENLDWDVGDRQGQGGKEILTLSPRPPVKRCLRTASTYHMLSHLYNLRPIPSLPIPFKTWLKDRIRALELLTDPEDLARLHELAVMAPSDGFPINTEDEGPVTPAQLLVPKTRSPNDTVQTDSSHLLFGFLWKSWIREDYSKMGL